MDPQALRDALFDIVADGDISALESHFALAHVREMVDAAEAIIVSTQTRYLGGFPGYDCEWSFQPYTMLFRVAINHGRINVLQWFFSPERATYMRASLVCALSMVACHAVHVDNPESLELLLSWNESLPKRAQFPSRRLMEDLVRSVTETTSIDTLQLLLSHGANLNTHEVLDRCATRGCGRQIDLLGQEGTVIVGTHQVIYSVSHENVSATRQLLHWGADWGFRSNEPLRIAARKLHLELVKLLVYESFADVDARSGWDETPLILALAKNTKNMGEIQRVQEEVVETLLTAGADVNFVCGGKTTLHEAVYCCLIEVVDTLLQYGADPNIHTKYKDVRPVLFDVHLCRVADTAANGQATQLNLLLRYGADPFHVYEGTSMYDQLMEIKAGRSFVQIHPQYFVRHTTEHDCTEAAKYDCTDAVERQWKNTAERNSDPSAAARSLCVIL